MPTHSAVKAERIVLQAYQQWGLSAIVLRGATLYHPESWHIRYFIDQLKRRLLPVIGDGKTYWHYIYMEDMARAIVCAVENAENAAGEIFFVADDQPIQAKDFLNDLVDCLGAPHPMQVPVWLARMFAGSIGVNVLTMSARYKTDRIKKRLGWFPQFPTCREGFVDVLTNMRMLSVRSISSNRLIFLRIPLFRLDLMGLLPRVKRSYLKPLKKPVLITKAWDSSSQGSFH